MASSAFENHGNDINLYHFMDHVRATKPPYDCPFPECDGKRYRSYRGICSHLLKDHAFNGEEDAQTHEACTTLRNLSVRQFGARHGGKGRVGQSCLPQRERSKFVDVMVEGQMTKLSIFEPMEFVTKHTPFPAMQNPLPMSDKPNEDTNAEGKHAVKKIPFKIPDKPYRLLNTGDRRILTETITLPAAYHHHLEENPDELEESVEYVMDEMDTMWLETMNQRRNAAKFPAVSDDNFEFIMDRLEKGAHFKSRESKHAEDIAVCSICNDGECENQNAILLCDLCDLAVHQECYGIPLIPEGVWLCKRCELSPSQEVTCVLCTNRGGAFKRTTDGRWAHVICALWVPEIQFTNFVFMEPIDGFKSVPPARWKLKCFICQQKGVGACIQCHRPSCYTAFHVTCGQAMGLYMNIEGVWSAPTGGADTPKFTVKKAAFCDVHAPADWIDRRLVEVAESFTPRKNNPNAPTPDRAKLFQIRLRNARQMIRKYSEMAPVTNAPVVSKQIIDSITHEVPSSKTFEFIKRIYAYWHLKRKDRGGLPLLRRLQLSKLVVDCCLRTTTNTTADSTSNSTSVENVDLSIQVQQWRRLRQDLERVRLLVELIRKREKSKVEEITEIFEPLLPLLMQPRFLFFQGVVDMLQQMDSKHNVFANPVSEKDVPGYRSLVKRPMDFSTIRRKIALSKYHSISDIENDFKLMLDNCLNFNPKDTYFHKHAMRLRRESKPIFIEASTVEQDQHYNKLGLHQNYDYEQIQFSTDCSETLKELLKRSSLVPLQIAIVNSGAGPDEPSSSRSIWTKPEIQKSGLKLRETLAATCYVDDVMTDVSPIPSARVPTTGDKSRPKISSAPSRSRDSTETGRRRSVYSRKPISLKKAERRTPKLKLEERLPQLEETPVFVRKPTSINEIIKDEVVSPPKTTRRRRNKNSSGLDFGRRRKRTTPDSRGSSAAPSPSKAPDIEDVQEDANIEPTVKTVPPMPTLKAESVHLKESKKDTTPVSVVAPDIKPVSIVEQLNIPVKSESDCPVVQPVPKSTPPSTSISNPGTSSRVPTSLGVNRRTSVLFSSKQKAFNRKLSGLDDMPSLTPMVAPKPQQSVEGVDEKLHSNIFAAFRNNDPKSPEELSDDSSCSEVLPRKNLNYGVDNSMYSTDVKPVTCPVSISNDLLTPAVDPKSPLSDKLTKFEPFDLVWASVPFGGKSNSVWFPAIVFNDEMCVSDDPDSIPVTLPPINTVEQARCAAGEEKEFLVCLFDEKNSWFFVTVTELEHLFVDVEKDEERIKSSLLKKEMKPIMNEAIKAALEHRSRQTGEPMPPNLLHNDDSSDSDDL